MADHVLQIRLSTSCNRDSEASCVLLCNYLDLNATHFTIVRVIQKYEEQISLVMPSET